MSEQSLVRTVVPPLPVDLGLTFWPLRRGFGDPTTREETDGSWWRSSRTPEGPATTRFVADSRGIRVEGWGPGARLALDMAPDLLGASDSLEGFEPVSRVVRELHRKMPGLRITRSRAVFEALLPQIIEQKVVGKLARASFRSLVLARGEPAPGPGGLMVQPAPEDLAAMRYDEFHPFGIEMRRANVIRRAASMASRLESASSLAPSDARRLLMALPGIGPWTAAEVAIVALGDADAVCVGDYHVAHNVAWALAHEPRASDARMLELLEPYRGHRGRVIRLIGASGFGAPRFGPKQRLHAISRI